MVVPWPGAFGRTFGGTIGALTEPRRTLRNPGKASQSTTSYVLWYQAKILSLVSARMGHNFGDYLHC
jgi:hypothetical protein